MIVFHFCSYILVVCLLLTNLATAQLKAQTHRASSTDLKAFAQKQQKYYNINKRNIQSFAEQYNIPTLIHCKNGCYQQLFLINNNKPIYLTTHNVIAASTISADLLWPSENTEFNLTGNGTPIGIWDGGGINEKHQEFNDNRIWQRDSPPIFLNHSTHVAGTIAASGFKPECQGVAPSVSLLAYDFSNDITEMALAASENLSISNHSYGVVCGWCYNYENEMWYWHGDLSYDSYSDIQFGRYDSTSWAIDYIAYKAPGYLIVQSAGNNRKEGPIEQPLPHYHWDNGWKLANDLHSIDGNENGFYCIGPRAVSKNNLVIGSIDDLPNGFIDRNDIEIADYSSFGPCNDGRIKPDLVANGETVLSCINDSLNAYFSYSGTSMAAASVSGAIALILEYQQHLNPGSFLLSSTIKALLINTADECGPMDGPDYQYGWGLINIHHAALCLQKNWSSGGMSIIEETITNKESQSIPIIIDSDTKELKVTLCWTDPPGEVFNNETNSNLPLLINDLNLSIHRKADNQQYYPWLLNPNSPESAATTGVNSIDNIEQIQLKLPTSGEYIINIDAQLITDDQPQSYSLIIEGQKLEIGILPPTKLKYRIGDQQIHLTWTPPSSTPLHYNIYCNNTYLTSTVDTTITLYNLVNNSSYELFVKAVHNSNKESLPTNIIKVTPVLAISPPFYTDFENDVNQWLLKQSIDGWRWGNKDSLTSYYLSYVNENDGQFIWIDSGINNWHSHVSDICISPPMNLEDHQNITITFDYVFVTGIYDVIDELHLVYRQVGDPEWQIMHMPPASSKWNQVTYTLPQDAAKNNVQFGFYYDDFYRHGMGAALDNILITSQPITDTDLLTLTNYIFYKNNLVSIETLNHSDALCHWQLFDLNGRTIENGLVALSNGLGRFSLNINTTGIYILKCRVGSTSSVLKIHIQSNSQ